MIKQGWQRQGCTFAPTTYDPDDEPGALPPGIYSLVKTKMGIVLDRNADEYPMPPKVYGLLPGFVERVARSWGSGGRSLGVLLHGLRGTGKSLTAMAVCNHMALPIITVSQAYEDLPAFIAELRQDVVLFFDEFEKTFKEDQGRMLLAAMDGAENGQARKLFLLTANETHLDANFLDRPGRIRYKVRFDNLDAGQIRAIAEDRLLDKNRIGAVVDYVRQLEIITVDIVTAVVDEVNIHGENPQAFGHIFNARRVTQWFDVVEVKNFGKANETTKLLHKGAKVSPATFDPEIDYVGMMFSVYGQFNAEIAEVLSSDTARVVRYGDSEDSTKCKKESVLRLVSRCDENLYYRATKKRNGKVTPSLVAAME